MTESQWLTCIHPRKMHALVTRNRSGRKLQLIGCAMARFVWDRIDEPIVREGILAVEKFVDGELTHAEYLPKYEAAQAIVQRRIDTSLPTGEFEPLAGMLVAQGIISANLVVAVDRVLLWTEFAVMMTATSGQRLIARENLNKRACDLYREIVGNPFRVYLLRPNFAGGGICYPDGSRCLISETAKQIAQGISLDGGYDRMPILADAMEDAGCDDRVMLDHLRSPTVNHVRGCWALDVILGRDRNDGS